MHAQWAVVFPGQGSQAVGMLGESAERYPVIRETFAEASAIFGADLWALAQEGPAEALNRTEITQPIMLVAGVAVWRVLQAHIPQPPQWLAGHSLGEYTALVAAQALSFAEAIPLVQERAAAMQTAVPEGVGAMAAILALDDEAIARICAEQAEGDVLEPVNYNAPGQVVIAGTAAAVERGIAAARAAGARKAVRLPMSVPSHCALLRPAAERLDQALQAVTWSMPAIPVLHNVTAQPAADLMDLQRLLAEQIYRPVRWVETVRAMHDAGVTRVVECGPGRVLTGLNKRIQRDLESLDTGDLAALEKTLQQCC